MPANARGRGRCRQQGGQGGESISSSNHAATGNAAGAAVTIATRNSENGSGRLLRGVVESTQLLDRQRQPVANSNEKETQRKAWWRRCAGTAMAACEGPPHILGSPDGLHSRSAQRDRAPQPHPRSRSRWDKAQWRRAWLLTTPGCTRQGGRGWGACFPRGSTRLGSHTGAGWGSPRHRRSSTWVWEGGVHGGSGRGVWTEGG